MKTRLLLCVIMALWVQSSAQVALSEDFTTGIPSGWNITGSSVPALWQYNDSLDKNNGGCIVANIDHSSMTDSTIIELPSVNIGNSSDPYINFSAAIVNGNFISPELSLLYKENGVWKEAETWAFYPQKAGVPTRSSFSAQPLIHDNIRWVDIQYSLKPFRNMQNIELAFKGNIINGGWLLLDSIYVTDNTYPIVKLPFTEGFEGLSFLPEGWQRKGTDYLSDWVRNDSAGAFDVSSACVNFNRFSNGHSGSVYELQSPWFEITGTTLPSLSFDYAYTKNPNTLSDRLSIWYQIENRQWVLLEELSISELQTAPDQVAQFIPNSRQWMQKTMHVPVQGFQGKARIAFRYHVESGFIFYLDNVSLRDAVSVNDYNNIDFKVYPNPAQDQLYIDVVRLNSIYMYDIAGRQLAVAYEEKDNKVIVDISRLSKGVYILQVDADGIRETTRVLIE